MWELDHKEIWALKSWFFWTVVLEKTLKSPLNCKEIKPVNPKGNQPWIFIGKTDAEAPILWPPNSKNWLIGKGPDAEKDGRRRGEQRARTVGWHHGLDGHESEQALGVGDGQGNLACCSPWGCKESDTTQQLNWTDWLSSHGDFSSLRMLDPLKGFMFLLCLGLRKWPEKWLWIFFHKNPT